MSNFEHIFDEMNFKKIDMRAFHSELGRRLDLEAPSSAEKIRTDGYLSIYRIYDDGERRLAWSRHNLMMTQGFETLARIWGEPQSPDTFDDLKPAWIAIGDPASPTLTQKTQLDQLQLARGFDQVTYLGSPSINGVQFETIVPKTIGNGFTYTEAGLFSNRASTTTYTTDMIAYQTYTGIPKNSSFQLAYNWRFTFTAS